VNVRTYYFVIILLILNGVMICFFGTKALCAVQHDRISVKNLNQICTLRCALVLKVENSVLMEKNARRKTSRHLRRKSLTKFNILSRQINAESVNALTCEIFIGLQMSLNIYSATLIT
jgi:hypothetical protein